MNEKFKNQEEQNYLSLLEKVYKVGNKKEDRTGDGTKSLFGETLRFSLENNILPLLTSKKMFFRGIAQELIFFISGNSDTNVLKNQNIHIWDGNTSRSFLDSRGLTNLPEGDMGLGYGHNWRNFNGTKDKPGIDQLANLLDMLKSEPNSRRILMTAWNPSETHLAALPPCHCFIELYVNGDELSLMWINRSCDLFHGFGFNLGSYALLTHILAKASNLRAKEVIFVGGDVHIYNSHLLLAEEQLKRETFPFPQIKINKDLSSIKDIEGIEFKDLELINYVSGPTIKGSMVI